MSDDGLSLRQQIRQYARADRLVLGHGAGMIHLLWMRPHANVVEVINAEKLGHDNGGVQGCVRLATLRGFTLERLVVSKALGCAVDPQAIVTAFGEAASAQRRGARCAQCGRDNGDHGQ